MGLTVPDAVRLALTRAAREKEPPFASPVPGAGTVAAMNGARTDNPPTGGRPAVMAVGSG